MQKRNFHPMVTASLFFALTFLGTLISIPSPVGGNLNLGDGFLLLGCGILGLPWSISCALGAAACDLIGYPIYAPATLVIKTGICLITQALPHLLPKGKGNGRFLIAGAIGEIWMVIGYYLYEAILFSTFVTPIGNIPMNLVQGAFALLLCFFCRKRIQR